ncbi:MAG TPA: hypothetical protein VJ111_16450, partial [Chitinophagaceae bacterium]|nr:hypothetical protein [Chitinophagaceae bacterium]
CGLVERYMNLQPSERNFLLHDINFKEGIQVGNNYCQLFTLADAQDLPAYCGSRINYDKYSTDKQNSVLGLLYRLDSYYPAIISITNTSL